MAAIFLFLLAGLGSTAASRPVSISANVYAPAEKGPEHWRNCQATGLRTQQRLWSTLFKIKRPERGNQLGNGWRKKQGNVPPERKPISARKHLPVKFLAFCSYPWRRLAQW